MDSDYGGNLVNTKVDDNNDDDDDTIPSIKIDDLLSDEALNALKEYLKIDDSIINVVVDNDIGSCMQPSALDPTEIRLALETLKSDGIVRINNVVSRELCDECLQAINHKLALAIESGTDHFSEVESNGFGNIKPNEFRWDMFLDFSSPYSKVLTSIMGSVESNMSQFYKDLFQPNEAEWYELGAVISDPGSKSQTIHPDTNYQELCPLYTMFIALQDISAGMGPTIYLPGTHTEEAHQHFHRRKEWLLAKSEYRHGVLNKGDVVIMDSRLLHCGGANSLSRRVVMYFTQLNPRYKEANGGSTKFDYMKLPVAQIKDSYVALNTTATLSESSPTVIS